MVPNRAKHYICVTILWTPGVKRLKTTVRKSPYLDLNLLIWKNAEQLQEIINPYTQPAFTCSELTKETLEQGVKYVQS